MKKIENIIKKRAVILDGATGTQLQKLGLPAGVCPETWCLSKPAVLAGLHKEYKKAGSDIIYTATFGANRLKLSQFGRVPAKKVNKELALIARESAGRNTLVAGDIGPTGKLVEPFGNLKFAEAVDIFKEQAEGLLAGGVDIFVIETMIDIQEARAALLAVRELSSKFTIVSMTFEKGGFTLGGTDLKSALITLQSMGAGAFGCNCSSGPKGMVDIIKRIKPYAVVPLLAKPNAGLPRFSAGEAVFDMPPAKFSRFCSQLIKAGANFIGGCCGTTPAHIKALKKKSRYIRPDGPLRKSLPAVSSPRSCFIFGEDKPLALIGECINPSGRKKLTAELKKGKFSLLRSLAKKQEACGADILDVNVAAAGVDEKKMIAAAVKLLARDINLPLQVDSASPQAIERFLKLYPGRAIINSISADSKKAKKLLRLASAYGAMFVALPVSGRSIPKDLSARKRNIEKIHKAAEKSGFGKDDFIVDALALSAASGIDNSMLALQAVKWLKDNGYRSVVGLSNISFGLPRRRLINSVFLNLARANGLDCVIANPLSEEMMKAKRAGDFLLGKRGSKEVFFAGLNRRPKIYPGRKNLTKTEAELYQSILEGRKEDAKKAAGKALSSGSQPYSLVDNLIVPVLAQTGELFDKRIYFLPQLISAAEAAKEVFRVLRPRMKGKRRNRQKTVIVLATVKGDIHDIGKNIVALMLENHGFEVIDLGKDVSAARIIQAAMRHKAPLVGLSALMTTTMVNMEEVVSLAKTKKLKCKFIVGGAVVNKNYARHLGAEYAGDGLQAVRVAGKFKKK